MSKKPETWSETIANILIEVIMKEDMWLRQINGLTWQQIAFSIDEYDEQYPRRKHDAFFKNHGSYGKEEIMAI